MNAQPFYAFRILTFGCINFCCLYQIFLEKYYPFFISFYFAIYKVKIYFLGEENNESIFLAEEVKKSTKIRGFTGQTPIKLCRGSSQLGYFFKSFLIQKYVVLLGQTEPTTIKLR
jgi:hypothetical protein